MVLWRSRDHDINAQSAVWVHRGGALAGGSVVDSALMCSLPGVALVSQRGLREDRANHKGQSSIPKGAQIHA